MDPTREIETLPEYLSICHVLYTKLELANASRILEMLHARRGQILHPWDDFADTRQRHFDACVPRTTGGLGFRCNLLQVPEPSGNDDDHDNGDDLERRHAIKRPGNKMNEMKANDEYHQRARAGDSDRGDRRQGAGA